MQSSGTNLLLQSLTNTNRDLIVSQSRLVEMPLRQVIYRSEDTPRFAYFLLSGVASLVTTMEEGAAAEVGMIGAEGLLGGFPLLGPAATRTVCVMQSGGVALRIPFDQLRDAFEEHNDVRKSVLEFIQEQALSLYQIAACHGLHEVEERLARWLLMMQDRTASDVLVLTQEFLAQMLASRRTTVTIAAGILQKAGSIEYIRGRIHILSRPQLEAAACSCYPIVGDLHRGLYSRSTSSRSDNHSPNHSNR